MKQPFELPLGTQVPPAPYPLKRWLDLSVGLMAALATLPLLVSLALLLWMLERRSPWREVEAVGRKGRVFWLVFLDNQSPRRKRLFKWLTRDTRRLEQAVIRLPQLWQVVDGSLSLVGPSPPMFRKAVFLDGCLEGYRERLEYAPGLVRIDALAPPDCNEQARLEFSQLYIRRASFGFDLWVLGWMARQASYALIWKPLERPL